MTRKTKIKYLFGISFIMCSAVIFGQLPFKQFGVSNYGMSVQQPFHSGGKFWQDSLGKLNFNNQNFDGHRFIKSTNDFGKLLHIDSKGGRWYKKDHFEILYSYGEFDTLINTQQYFKYDVNSVYVKEGRVFLVTNLGAIEYSFNNLELKYIRSIPISDEEIWAMHQIGDTLFFKSLKQSTYVIQSNIEKETTYGPKNLSNFNNGIIFLPNQRIICRSDKYEYLFNNDNYIYRTIEAEDDNDIISHLIDSKNRLWLSLRGGENRNGLFLATPENPSLKQIELGIEKGSFIRNLFEDDQGNIWVGTGGQGIIQLYEEQIQVLDKNFGLTSDNIWSVSQKKNGEIYFSTSCAGINTLDQKGTLTHLFGTNCLPVNFHDSNDILWMSDKGVTKISANGRRVRYTKEDGLMSRNVRLIFQDSEQNIWVGTRKGIHKYIPSEDEISKGKFIAYPAPGVEEFDRVSAMREYEKHKFIIAFNSGKLFSFDGTGYAPIDFENRIVNTIFKDQEGNIWITSNGDGLYLYSGAKGIIPAPKKEELPKNVKFLQDDLVGKMWGICEGNQVFYFNKKSALDTANHLQLAFFSTSDGIPLIASNNDIQPSSILLQDGRIIFPNIYGALLINPNKKFEAVQNYHTQIEVADSISGRNIVLSTGQNDIALSLKPIVLSKNQTIEYQYQQSSDETWKATGSPGVLALNNLPSGKNKIRLRTRNGENAWHLIEPVFITVPPYYYQRWYFWPLTGLVLSGLVLLLIKWRTSIVKKRNKLLKEKVAEQTLELNQEKEQLSKSLNAQKRLTHELNLSQEAKNRMYAQISHEFKSPLQAIKANLKNGDGTLIVQNHNRISANINNLIEISNEIMELSKAESGKLKAKKNWYNINGIIKEQVELLKPLADQKKIDIVFQYEQKRFFLDIDISLIQKVIGNLLSNAIKFSSVNQIIRIDSKTTHNGQLIEIMDQGLGIPEAEVSSLILPYYQASNNIKKGTGIGLSLVSEILKLHETNLEIKSELGVGSTFSFCLPKPTITQEDIIKKHIDLTDIKSQIQLAEDTEKTLILAVDDSRDVLFFINQTLNKNYHIINANNGEIALKILDNIDPQLIISDVNMPVLDGMEFLKAVRNIERFKTTPFLFLTGSLSQDTELQSMKAGADYLIQKPIQEDYLLSKIEQMMAMRRNLEEKVKSSFAHNLLPKNIHNDDLFLMKELETVILENISNCKLKSVDIASLLGIGEKTLRNRVKSIAGHTLKEYLRRIRLEKAKLLIEEDYGNLGEIATATGFSSLSYFSKSYKAYFEKEKQI